MQWKPEVPCNSYALDMILSATVHSYIYICWHKYETPCLVKTSPSPTQTNNKLSYFQLNIDHFCDIIFGRKEQYGAASSLIPGCGFWSELLSSQRPACPCDSGSGWAGAELLSRLGRLGKVRPEFSDPSGVCPCLSLATALWDTRLTWPPCSLRLLSISWWL